MPSVAEVRAAFLAAFDQQVKERRSQRADDIGSSHSSISKPCGVSLFLAMLSLIESFAQNDGIRVTRNSQDVLLVPRTTGISIGSRQDAIDDWRPLPKGLRRCPCALAGDSISSMEDVEVAGVNAREGRAK